MELLCFWGKHLLDGQQQHTISRSNAEAELHEIVNGMARGLFGRNVSQSVDVVDKLRVGSDSSAASGGILKRLGAGHVRHLEAKDL